MVGLEGVEMSPGSPTVITEVSQLMNVESMFARLQTFQSATETEPRLMSEEMTISAPWCWCQHTE